MPVLPLVASINTSPGLISPRFSASTIIESAARSFTEPAGLLPSSFNQTSLPLFGPIRCNFTRGVLPIVCSNVLTISIHTWCCLMRRLRVLSGLQVTNLAIKSPDRGKRLRAFNIHSTYQALCARASSSSRVSIRSSPLYSRACCRPTNKRSPRCGHRRHASRPSAVRCTTQQLHR